MIELLLQAERAISVGLVDQAERLYRQAADADPRNSIAVVGLARVALERNDDLGAYLLARRASAIDPENPAARRLVVRLEEVMRHRGDAIPAAEASARPPGAGPATSRSPVGTTDPVPAIEPDRSTPAAAEMDPASPAASLDRGRPSRGLRRFFRRGSR